jgi:hypothetical protein
MVEATGFLPQRQMVEGSGFAAPFRTLKTRTLHICPFAPIRRKSQMPRTEWAQ